MILRNSLNKSHMIEKLEEIRLEVDQFNTDMDERSLAINESMHKVYDEFFDGLTMPTYVEILFDNGAVGIGKIMNVQFDTDRKMYVLGGEFYWYHKTDMNRASRQEINMLHHMIPYRMI